jgi:hypothetical protein
MGMVQQLKLIKAELHTEYYGSRWEKAFTGFQSKFYILFHIIFNNKKKVMTTMIDIHILKTVQSVKSLLDNIL